jgi:hypothetical protein
MKAKELWTNEIFKYMEKFCKRRRAQFDVIPCDKLTEIKIIKYPLCLVVNTDTSEESGKHWVSFYIDNIQSYVEFYDSYGLGIEIYSHYFKDFVTLLNRPLKENIVQIQNYESVVCGHYAIYFMYKRICGHASLSIYCKFSSNYKKNDNIVQQFIKSKSYLLQNSCKMVQCKHDQCCIAYCCE